jgi:hypothetical protein
MKEETAKRMPIIELWLNQYRNSLSHKCLRSIIRQTLLAWGESFRHENRQLLPADKQARYE